MVGVDRRRRSATTVLVERDGLGVCEFWRDARERAYPGPVTLQNSYSLVSRGVDNDLAETLFRESMSLLATARSPAGCCTGKYPGGAQPPKSRFTLFDRSACRFKATDGRRSDRRVCRRREAARFDAPAACARLCESAGTSARRSSARRPWRSSRRTSPPRRSSSMRRLSTDIAAVQPALPESGGLNGRQFALKRYAHHLLVVFGLGQHRDFDAAGRKDTAPAAPADVPFVSGTVPFRGAWHIAPTFGANSIASACARRLPGRRRRRSRRADDDRRFGRARPMQQGARPVAIGQRRRTTAAPRCPPAG